MHYNWQDDKRTQEICRSIGSYPYITNYDAQNHIAQVQKEYNVESLLDLGCGRGNVLDFGLSLGFKTVDGVEYFQSYISAARRRLRQYAKSRYTIYQGDIRIWKPKKKYDLLYTFEPIFEANARRLFHENLLNYLPDGQLMIYAAIDNELTHKLFTSHFEHVAKDEEMPLFKFHRKPVSDRNTFWKCQKKPTE